MSVAAPVPALASMPAELLSAIGEALLAGGDRASLARLARVCRALRAAALPLLYRRLETPSDRLLRSLTSKDGADKAAALRQLGLSMGGGKTSAKLQLDLLKLVAHNLVELSVGICGGSSGTAIVRAMGKAKNLRYLELRCDAGSKNAVRRIEIPVGVRKLELAVADFDDLPAVWDLASRAPAVLQEWTIAVDSYKHRFYRPRVETMHLELFPAKIVGLLSSVQGWPSVLEALAVLPGLKLRNLVVTKARCFNNGLADTNFGAWWKIYEAMPSLRTVSFENIRTDCHVLHGLPGAVEELHLINPGWTLSQEAAREQLRTALRRMDKLWLIEIKIEGDYWGARDWNNERPFWDALAEEAWARASISL